MNSLLNSLKKADEEKRKRAQLLAESAAAEEVHGAVVHENDVVEEVTETWAFNAAAATEEFPPAEQVAKLSLEIIEPSEDVPESLVAQSSEVQLVLDEPDEGRAEEVAEQPEPLEPPELSAEPVNPSVGVPESAAQNTPAQSAAVPTQKSVAPALAAVPGRAAPATAAPRSVLPWIVLGGGVLLGSLIAWFAWQYQQLTQGTLAPLPSAQGLAAATTPETSPEAEVLAAERGSLEPPRGYASAASAIKASSVNTVASMSASSELPTRSPMPMPPERKSAKEGAAQEVRFEKVSKDPNAPIEAAWRAYQAGELDTAEQLYRRILSTEPKQRDALLGLAAVQVRRGQTAQALGVYQYLLQLNPQDAEAQQAQLALSPERLNTELEARLQQQDGTNASPILLGQYYASRKMWAQAQQQYFLAWSAQPEQADLAFNLAISLDHLQQQKLAADFYQKALDLARNQAATFDLLQAERRLAQLRLAGF